MGFGKGESGRLSMHLRQEGAIHEVTIVPVSVIPRDACSDSSEGKVTTPLTGLQFSVAVHAVWAMIGVTYAGASVVTACLAANRVSTADAALLTVVMSRCAADDGDEFSRYDGETAAATPAPPSEITTPMERTTTERRLRPRRITSSFLAARLRSPCFRSVETRS